MAQLDSYLRRMFSEYDLSFLDDYHDMYDFVPNDDLRKILAAFHTNLNNWITVINADIRTTCDEDGNVIIAGAFNEGKVNETDMRVIHKKIIDLSKSYLDN